jgi:hypothetical protein
LADASAVGPRTGTVNGSRARTRTLEAVSAERFCVGLDEISVFASDWTKDS